MSGVALPSMWMDLAYDEWHISSINIRIDDVRCTVSAISGWRAEVKGWWGGVSGSISHLHENVHKLRVKLIVRTKAASLASFTSNATVSRRLAVPETESGWRNRGTRACWRSTRVRKAKVRLRPSCRTYMY